MTFSDQFREKYRAALHAARGNDQEATLKGLVDLYNLFAEQYSLNNGDSIVVKAKLSYWQDVFGGYIDIIRKNGLQDRRVQKFFGLNEDTDIPSFGDILGGNGRVLPPQGSSAIPSGGVNIDGIVEPQKPAAEPQKPSVVDPSPMIPEPAVPIAKGQGEEPNTDSPVPVPAPSPVIEEPPAAPNGREIVAKPVYEPDSLEGFIGQRHIVKVLLKEIAIAKAEGKHHLDNILLFGNPGLGKTTLMSLIAKELGVRFEKLDCTTLSSRNDKGAVQEFLMRVARENEPVVIAFDEIHKLSESAQSCLLTLLESREFITPISQGRSMRMPIEEFTFIAATTDDNDVLDTIKDRCLRLKFQMEDYSSDELAQIYRAKVASLGLTITEEAIETCIPRSRGSVRYINSFVEGMKTELYDEKGHRITTHIDREIALRFFEEMGIDPMGLGKKDLEILRAIDEEASGVLGAETLAARVGLDPKKYASEYEPYLLKIQFISKTPRGRCLTDKAKKYMKGEEE